MATGALQGWTTQDTVHTPLIPASSGSTTEFYNAVGAFAVPILQSLPFKGACLLSVAEFFQDAVVSHAKTWTETGGFDVGGCFDSSTDASKFVAPVTGKYFVHVTIPVFTNSINVTGPKFAGALVLNGATILAETDEKAIIAAPVISSSAYTGRYLALSSVVTLTAADYLQVLVSQTVSDGQSVTFGGTTSFTPNSRAFAGRFICFRVE
jgi:hypothetical protein